MKVFVLKVTSLKQIKKRKEKRKKKKKRKRNKSSKEITTPSEVESSIYCFLDTDIDIYTCIYSLIDLSSPSNIY